MSGFGFGLFEYVLLDSQAMANAHLNDLQENASPRVARLLDRACHREPHRPTAATTAAQ